MRIEAVNSSSVESIGWEYETMVVKFRKGSTYVYFNISEEEYESIIKSPSVGSKLKEVVIGKRYKKHG